MLVLLNYFWWVKYFRPVDEQMDYTPSVRSNLKSAKLHRTVKKGLYMLFNLTSSHSFFSDGLQSQISSMQANFIAYSYATKYHSLALSRLRQEVDELKFSNKNKDIIISQHEEIIAKMSLDSAELKQDQEGILHLLLCVKQSHGRVYELHQKIAYNSTVIMFYSFLRPQSLAQDTSFIPYCTLLHFWSSLPYCLFKKS